MIDADLQDPPELIPRDDRPVEPAARTSSTPCASSARARPRFKLATASWFYKLFDKLAQVDLEPNSGDFRLLDRRALERAAGDDRALALPARHDRVGGLHPDRRLLRARRAPRRRDEVHAAQDAALLARRDRLLLAPAPAAGHLRRPALGRRRVHRDPGRDRAAHRRLLPAGLRLDHDRDPAARRHPADRARRDRRVRRAHLRRGQAPPAVHRARGAQPPRAPPVGSGGDADRRARACRPARPSASARARPVTISAAATAASCERRRCCDARDEASPPLASRAGARSP